MKRFLIAVICLVLAVGMCGCSESPDSKTARISLDDSPSGIDPQLADNRCELLIVRNVFEGLMRTDKSGSTVCGAAEKYTLSDDRLTYTFTLRDGLKWSDGRAMTADDFVFGITRALLPETACPSARQLFSIKNAKKVADGQLPEASLGVKSDGEKKVIITLEKADNRFLTALTYSAAMPCNREFFYGTKGRYGLSSASILCNGSFKIVRWLEDSVRISKNSNYTGDFGAKIGSVILSFDSNSAERLNEVGSGISDAAFIDDMSADFSESPHLVKKSYYDTSWTVLINPGASVIGNPSVAGCFSAALEHSSVTLPHGFVHSGSVISPDLYVGDVKYGSNPLLDDPVFNPSQAQSQLIDWLKNNKRELGPITLIYADGYGLNTTATQLAADWQKNLNAYVNIKAVGYGELKSRVDSGDYQLALCPISSRDGQAGGVLENAVFSADKAVSDTADSLSSMTHEQAKKALQQAEKRLVGSAYIIPVALSGTSLIYDDGLTGMIFDLHPGNLDLYTVCN